MKTSCTWLSDYVDVPWKPSELADALTMAGLEVEGIEILDALPAHIVVAQVLSRAQHPNPEVADKLSVVTVDDGTGAPVPVVCGAPNCNVGYKIAFARVGADLGGGFVIKKAKLKGEPSHGMICSERELGLSEAHEGIMELPADAPIGVPLGEYLKHGDTMIDWEVTPNRPDWLSHVGIAREISALTGLPLRKPALALPAPVGVPITAVASVTVEAPDLCPRYTARLIRGVKIGPSPEWLRKRLAAIGLRSINNVVDITNFVMMELGQPLHAFDYDRLAGGRIVVRRATPGESITTLNEATFTLTANHLLICDAERGVALAGVMGGANSEIGDGTTTVLLESAAFHASNIRATARGLGLGSDSSYRFERGVDLENVDYAGARAAQLICELAGGELAPGVIDVRVAPVAPAPVPCRYARAARVIGVDLGAAAVRSILERLGCTVVAADEHGLHVTPPSWRLDLEREADLVEEVARLHGLNNIPANTARAIVGGVRADDALYPWQALRRQCLGLGLDECVNYTLIGSATALHHSGYVEADLLQLKNPLSQQYNTLRPSLLPTMLANVAHNIAHGNHDLGLFEIGKAYCASARHPEERMELAVALSGRRGLELHGKGADGVRDFYDLRGVLDALLGARRVPAWTVRAATHPAFRAGHCAELLIGKTVIGVFGEVSKAHTRDIRLKYPLFLALLQADTLLAVPVPALAFGGLDMHPATSRDMAFTAPESLEHGRVLEVIAGCNQKLLESVEPFDVYRDAATIGPDRKSLAYRLVYRASDRTLTDDEVAKADGKIRKALAAQLPIELRES